jgi:hypothetical protein
MAYNIKPFESVGPILFGATRKETREKLGEFQEFKKTKFSKNTTDDFGCFHVYYDTSDIVVAVEFFRNAEVTFKNKNLFALDKTALISLFNDPSTIEEQDAVIFDSYGVEFTIEDDEVDSVFVHSKGY